MTKINKIVMHGFKSFAERTELLFGGDFNCIIGPNGSGKSNVLDALCFVLGKAGSKGLRAEKSANLIYNGGKKGNPAKHGEVSIYFDNRDKIFPTEDKEIKITRIVMQNGQSKYKINDKTRTRQQILDLLGLAKIDPNGYNIILQGDIVRFTGMPSVERRMLIEDISGITMYEEKKHKAELELEKVGSKLSDVDIVLTERGTYLKELKKDRDQALKYKDMNDRIKQNKASYLKLQIDKQETDKNKLEESMKKEQERLDRINEIIKSLKESNEEKRKEADDINSKIEEGGENDKVGLNKEVENLKVSLATNHNKIEHFKDEINRIEQRKQNLNSSLKELGEKIKELSEKKDELEKEKKNNFSEKEEISKKIKIFKEKNNLDKVGDIEQNIIDIDERSEELQKEIHGLREKQQELIRKKDNLSYQINTISERIKKVLQIEKENKEQIDELKKKREEFKSSVEELNKLLDSDSEMAKELAELRKRLVESTEELARLEAKNAGIEESIGGSIAVKKVLGLKNKIKGIYGTVADLGKVNSKYSLALEVAAGPRIRSIVVEDDKTAVDCIKFLKQNKFGVAAFLPLNKIKGNKANDSVKKLANDDGCHGLAIDLIKFSPEFKNVFEYVFANTIVVDSIDTAKKLGIGKAKMVSLDGDIAEIRGVMKGGYRNKKIGLGFKEEDVLKDIEEYNNSIKKIKKSAKSLEEERISNEKRIEELRIKKANLEGDIIKTEKSLHLEDADIDVSKRQKDELNKSVEGVDREIEDAVENISRLNNELKDIKIKKQELRNKISELRNPALLAELNTFEEIKANLNEEIIRVDGEIKNIDEQINNIHSPEKEKTLQILKQHDSEIKQFNSQIKELQEKINEEGDILKEKEKLAAEFYSKFKALFDRKKRFDEEVNNNILVIEKKNQDSRDSEIKLNTFSIKKAEVVAKIAGLNQEFEQYHGVEILTDKSEEELKKEIDRFEKMQVNIGSVNMRALDIYDDVEKQYNELVGKKEKLGGEKEDVLEMMNEIDSKKKELFMKTYNIIRDKFRSIFSAITKKGEADLELENEENPFEAGLNIKVRITGNRFLDIRGLSGGEKTLTALAFIFSIQDNEPASFYILDEVDAALDKHNSERLSNLIAKYSEKAQYIMISHNDSIISKASKLYGVSMNEHNASKVVSLEI